MPLGIYLYTGIKLAFRTHCEFVLDLVIGTDSFSCCLARAEPQSGKLCRFCSVMAVGGVVCIWFNIAEAKCLTITILLFLFPYCTNPRIANQSIWLILNIFHFDISVVVFFPLTVSWLMDLWVPFILTQGRRMALPPRGQRHSQGLWLAPQWGCPRVPGAKGLLRRRSKLVTRREPVGNGSLGAQRTKTASLKDSTRWGQGCWHRITLCSIWG